MTRCMAGSTTSVACCVDDMVNADVDADVDVDVVVVDDVVVDADVDILCNRST